MCHGVLGGNIGSACTCFEHWGVVLQAQFVHVCWWRGMPVVAFQASLCAICAIPWSAGHRWSAAGGSRRYIQPCVFCCWHMRVGSQPLSCTYRACSRVQHLMPRLKYGDANISTPPCYAVGHLGCWFQWHSHRGISRLVSNSKQHVFWTSWRRPPLDLCGCVRFPAVTVCRRGF